MKSLKLAGLAGVLSLAFAAPASAAYPDACDIVIFSGTGATLNAQAGFCTSEDLGGPTGDARYLTPGATSGRVRLINNAEKTIAEPLGGELTYNGVTTSFALTKNAAGTLWDGPVFTMDPFVSSDAKATIFFADPDSATAPPLAFSVTYTPAF